MVLKGINIIWDDNMNTLLQEILLEARTDGRLVCGFYDAAQVMEKSPSSVLLCILPQNHLDDAETHIHSVLIEAFCFDNNISLIKVDSEEKLSELIAVSKNCCTLRYSRLDFRCVLVKHPQGFCSKSVECFVQNYKELYREAYPHPIIELPV